MAQSLNDFLRNHPPLGSISSRTPTARERQTQFMQNHLFSDDRAGARSAERLMNVVDLTGANIPAAAYDVGQAAARGDLPALALTAGAAVVPMFGRTRAGNKVSQFLKSDSGMFMGEKSATADKSLLDHAKSMKSAGLSKEQIHSKTGWFQGSDGRWRYEIPSNQAQYIGTTEQRQPGAVAPLAAVYNHPGLYEAYPQLAKIPVSRQFGLGAAGAYDPHNQRMMLSTLESNKSATSVLNHEVQHAIQDIEGFAGGAGNSPILASMKGSPANQVYKTKLAEYERARGRLANDAEKASLQQQAAEEGYERTAGEVEARNTQWRAYGNNARPPWETQDIPDSAHLFDEPQEGLLDKLFGKFKPSIPFGKKGTSK